ncbi:hypothetical protein UPYG_G00209510 [Umbra pygmaea]|uniref:Ion transport domain-containing protein n=1 Tax=Umbra pygmaea TaxID=75934 RepID=A0ABD0X7B4_UMBPY
MESKVLGCDNSYNRDSKKEKVLIRAEVVRCKLMETFHFQERLEEGQKQRGYPKYYSSDVLDEKKYTSLMGLDSHHLVRFKITPRRDQMITEEFRRLSRMKTSHAKYPPLNMFAHWMSENEAFKTLVVALIILNTIIMVIQAELFDNRDRNVHYVRLILVVLERCIMGVFLLEFTLKWVDNFWNFWKNTWNTLDFVVTFVSMIPDLLKLFKLVKHDSELLVVIKKFRILRCLKVVSKLRETRIIVLVIKRILENLESPLVMMLLLTYIFAIFGITLFKDFSRSNIDGLEFNMAFKNMYQTIITLFILTTGERWQDLLNDMKKVPELGSKSCSTYILMWLIIAYLVAFSVFTGIVLDTFENYRTDLREEIAQIEMEAKANEFKSQMINRRGSQMHLDTANKKASEEPSSSAVLKKFQRSNVPEIDWELFIQDNLKLIKKQTGEEKVTWPSDSLFRYFELMEELQHNLEERKRLQKVIVQAFLNFHDIEDSSSSSPSIPTSIT